MYNFYNEIINESNGLAASFGQVTQVTAKEAVKVLNDTAKQLTETRALFFALRAKRKPIPENVRLAYADQIQAFLTMTRGLLLSFKPEERLGIGIDKKTLIKAGIPTDLVDELLVRKSEGLEGYPGFGIVFTTGIIVAVTITAILASAGVAISISQVQNTKAKNNQLKILTDAAAKGLIDKATAKKAIEQLTKESDIDILGIGGITGTIKKVAIGLTIVALVPIALKFLKK